jgi:porin
MYRMVAIGLALATSLAGVARADQWTVPSVPWLLGDWGGLRTRLYQQGVDFQFGYANEFGTNTQGGVKRWAGYADQSQAGATFNLERLFGVKDAIFQVTFTERTGRNLVTDAQLNTLQLVQEVWGRGQTARLTQFWYDQHYLNDFISWKVGRMPVGGDFAAFGCDYQNLTFCGANIGNLVGNYIFNWPISQWATRIKFNFNGFGYFQVGAYDQNQQYLGYTEALAPVFYKDSSGVMLPAELAWLPKFANGALPGSNSARGIPRRPSPMWFSTSTAIKPPSQINLRSSTGDSTARISTSYSSSRATPARTPTAA